MRTSRRLVLAASAAAAALAMVATSAAAATTTIHRDNAAGAPYSGKVRSTLISAESVLETSLGNTRCNRSELDATTTSDGSTVTGTGGFFRDTRTADGSCLFGSGGTATVTPVNLPWTGGSVVYGPVAGGRDGTLTIANVQVRAVVRSTLLNATCYFNGGGTNRSITIDFYNADNPNRPVTSLNQAQGKAVRVRLVRASGSGFGCPSEGFMTANYKALGETTANSGVYDETLYVTS